MLLIGYRRRLLLLQCMCCLFDRSLGIVAQYTQYSCHGMCHGMYRYFEVHVYLHVLGYSLVLTAVYFTAVPIENCTFWRSNFFREPKTDTAIFCVLTTLKKEKMKSHRVLQIGVKYRSVKFTVHELLLQSVFSIAKCYCRKAFDMAKIWNDESSARSYI